MELPLAEHEPVDGHGGSYAGVIADGDWACAAAEMPSIYAIMTSKVVRFMPATLANIGLAEQSHRWRGSHELLGRDCKTLWMA